jgi:hypothetical protein
MCTVSGSLGAGLISMRVSVTRCVVQGNAGPMVLLGVFKSGYLALLLRLPPQSVI